MKVSITYETTEAFNLALGLELDQYKPANSTQIRKWMGDVLEQEADKMLDAFYEARKTQTAAIKANVTNG